jgi:hypothetical protein
LLSAEQVFQEIIFIEKGGTFVESSTGLGLVGLFGFS